MEDLRERPFILSDAEVLAVLDGRKTQARGLLVPQPTAYVPGPNVHAPKHPAAYLDAYCSAERTPANPRGMSEHWCWWTPDNRQGPDWIRCPFGRPGDRLWVREAWALEDCGDDGERVIWRADREAAWRADVADPSERFYLPSDYSPGRWRSSSTMPRWASRLALDVLGVRVARLQDVSEEEALAEGFAPVIHETWSAWDPETQGYPSFTEEPDAELVARRRLENVRRHKPTVIASARDQLRAHWTRTRGPQCWEANLWVFVADVRRVEASRAAT